MPSAEELHDDGGRSERAKETHRDGFDDAVWFRINVGRKNNADPKWLLPLICRRGGVTKNDVGAIRIAAGETFVGIAAGAAKNFAKAARKPGRDEDADVEITQSDGPPRAAARENKKRGKSGYQGRGGSGERGSGGHRGKRPTLGANFSGDGPKDGGKKRGKFNKDGKRPYARKKDGAPSKHGVRHKGKGNRPR